jgi:hypothetical protein
MEQELEPSELCKAWSPRSSGRAIQLAPRNVYDSEARDFLLMRSIVTSPHPLGRFDTKLRVIIKQRRMPRIF